MRANHLLLTLSAIFLISFLHAQTASPDSAAPYGLTAAQWKKAEKRWQRKNIDATLFLNDSTKLTGQILAVNDSTVTVWKGEALYSPAAADSLAVKIPLENVDSVHVYGRFKAPRGGLRGLLIGAGAGAIAGVGLVFAGQGYLPPAIGLAGVVIGMPVGYGIGKTWAHKRYEKRIDNTAMRGYALFTGTIPTQNNFDSVAKASPFITRAFPKKLISFSAYGGLPQVPFQFGTVQELSMCIGMGIGVNITPHWSAEASCSFLKADADISANGRVAFRTMRWRNFHITGNYSVFRTDRIAQRSYQFMLGVGYTYASIGNLAEVFVYQSPNSYGNRYSFDTNVHGFYLQAKAQVFTGSCLSFFVMGNTVFLPSITLPECKVLNPANGEVTGFDETVARFSWSALNVGFQYYFRKK